MKNKITTLFLYAICAFLFTGCATPAPHGGPIYPTVKAALAPKPGKALVICYSPQGFVAHVSIWNIYANNGLVTDKFMRGTFCAYQADPGELSITITRHKQLGDVLLTGIPAESPKIQVQEGQTYYMNLAFSSSIIHPFYFEPVSKETAEDGIKACEWINP
jgi:hypothetical protein